MNSSAFEFGGSYCARGASTDLNSPLGLSFNKLKFFSFLHFESHHTLYVNSDLSRTPFSDFETGGFLYILLPFLCTLKTVVLNNYSL